MRCYRSMFPNAPSHTRTALRRSAMGSHRADAGPECVPTGRVRPHSSLRGRVLVGADLDGPRVRAPSTWKRADTCCLSTGPRSLRTIRSQATRCMTAFSTRAAQRCLAFYVVERSTRRAVSARPVRTNRLTSDGQVCRSVGRVRRDAPSGGTWIALSIGTSDGWRDPTSYSGRTRSAKRPKVSLGCAGRQRSRSRRRARIRSSITAGCSTRSCSEPA